jgi:hypothetical protein
MLLHAYACIIWCSTAVCFEYKQHVLLANVHDVIVYAACTVGNVSTTLCVILCIRSMPS